MSTELPRALMAASVVVESLYCRDQFGDWVGGGQLRIGPSICRWSAYNSGCGQAWSGSRPGIAKCRESDPTTLE